MARAQFAGTRLPHIETVRGFACVLLVAFHVVGDSPANGMELPLDHPLHRFNALFADTRMPLFSFVSGLVFSPLVAGFGSVRGEIGKKARRLLLPMLCVGSLHWATQSWVKGGAETEYWRILVLPYEHFWFLQATFLIMASLVLAAFLTRAPLWKIALVVLPTAVCAYLFVERWRPDVFSGYKAVYLAPYFCAGLLWAAALKDDQWSARLARLRLPLFAAVALLWALLFLTELQILLQELNLERRLRLGLGVGTGLATCLLLMLARVDIPVLRWIGDKSYAIFLFHVFFTAGSRLVLDRLSPAASEALTFFTGLFAGVAGPILMQQAILQNRFAALALLGLKPRGARPGSSPRSPDNALGVEAVSTAAPTTTA